MGPAEVALSSARRKVASVLFASLLCAILMPNLMDDGGRRITNPHMPSLLGDQWTIILRELERRRILPRHVRVFYKLTNNKSEAHY